MELVTIGQVAKAAQVNVETIRFYQRMNLISEPAKPLGGVRRYSEETVLRVDFIKRAQQLGFSLEEIKTLLELEEVRSCTETHDLAVKKLAAVEARVADLNRIRRMLKKLINQCGAGDGVIACPIISSLSPTARSKKTVTHRKRLTPKKDR